MRSFPFLFRRDVHAPVRTLRVYEPIGEKKTLKTGCRDDKFSLPEFKKMPLVPQREKTLREGKRRERA